MINKVSLLFNQREIMSEFYSCPRQRSKGKSYGMI